MRSRSRASIACTGTLQSFRPCMLSGARFNGQSVSRLCEAGAAYRAYWEPAAPSRNCMAGVPGVFWRSPVVLWGPSTPNPTLTAGKTHTSKKWPIFPVCMWKWGGSAPCGQARLWRPNGPNVQKAMPFGSPPHQGLKNCGLSQKVIYIFLIFDFLGPTGLFFFAVFALLAIICSQHTF